MKLPVLRHEEEFGKDGSIYDKGSSATTPNNRPSTTSCLFRSNLCTQFDLWIPRNDCYQSSHDLKQVSLTRLIQYEDIVHAILWPCTGVIISFTGCVRFWKRNRNRLNTLFIYNNLSQ